LSSVDHDHLGVLSDGILRHDVLQFLVGLLGDVLIDLMTALLGLALEVALLDLGVQAGLDGLDESLLGMVVLVDDDGGGGLDRGALVLSSLLLLRILAVQALLQGRVGLTGLLPVQSSVQDALDLTLGLTTGTLLDGGQSQLQGDWGDDGVLVVVFMLGLLVQFGGQLGIGLFDGLQQLEAGSALVLLLLLALALLALIASLSLELVLVLVLVLILVFQVLLLLLAIVMLALITSLSLELVLVLILVFQVLFVAIVFGIIVVQVQSAVALVTRADALTLALLLLVVVILVILVIQTQLVAKLVAEETLSAVFVLILLLLLQGTEETVKAVSVGVGGGSHSQAESNHDEKTHDEAMIKSKIDDRLVPRSVPEPIPRTRT